MSIIKHVTLQKNVAHDFRYDPRNMKGGFVTFNENIKACICQVFHNMVSSWSDASASPYSKVCMSITSNNKLQVVSVAVGDFLEGGWFV